MRASQTPYFTQKEDPKDAQIPSHRLLSRAGLIRKAASGIYNFLPFGLRVHQKIEAIIREEMNKAGGVEVFLPILTDSTLWRESGRWEKMGKELIRLKDRHDKDLVLAPTHEEAICELVKTYLQSYKQLPLNLYQLGLKYRDEIRPRFGIIRSREFMMKDAYSFHLDSVSLEETYQEMRKAYRNIFSRVGLNTLPVEADSGTMGGAASEEFMVSSSIGEETLLICKNKNCDYQSNQEKTHYIHNQKSYKTQSPPAEQKTTPKLKSVEDVATYLKISTDSFIKAQVFESDESIAVVFIPGNRKLSETKWAAFTKIGDWVKASADTIQKLTNAEPGFTGPIGLNENSISIENQIKNILVVFDRSLKKARGLVSGANITDQHIINLDEGRDFIVPDNAPDLIEAEKDDPCPRCLSDILEKTRGIEVGHIFKLGNKYTKAMNVEVLDQSGKPFNPIMGCYGIGVGRTMATVVEQNHDDMGIIWPESIAPYQLVLIGLGKSDEELESQEKLYQTLCSNGYDVFFDDRKERAGSKFKDADLVGFPYQVIAGKTWFTEELIEIKSRSTISKNIKKQVQLNQLLGADNLANIFS